MADNSVWTIKKVLIWTTGYFEKHGIDSARLDAELLLSHVLGKVGFICIRSLNEF